jgi:hypothetical protein
MGEFDFLPAAAIAFTIALFTILQGYALLQGEDSFFRADQSRDDHC